MKSDASVTVTPNSDSVDDIISLTCEGTAHPFKTTAQLESYITIQWLGPTGVSLTEENDIILSGQEKSQAGVTRTLLFNGTRCNHAGQYTCKVILNILNSIAQTSKASHHLVLQSKFIRMHTLQMQNMRKILETRKPS